MEYYKYGDMMLSKRDAECLANDLKMLKEFGDVKVSFNFTYRDSDGNVINISSEDKGKEKPKEDPYKFTFTEAIKALNEEKGICCIESKGGKKVRLSLNGGFTVTKGGVYANLDGTDLSDKWAKKTTEGFKEQSKKEFEDLFNVNKTVSSEPKVGNITTASCGCIRDSKGRFAKHD